VLIHQSESCYRFTLAPTDQVHQSATSSSVETRKTHALFDRLLLGLSILTLVAPPRTRLIHLSFPDLLSRFVFLLSLLHHTYLLYIV
jgi:hypothetical protein